MPKIVIVVTEDWAFLSHRVAMALAARDQGAEVIVATRDNGRRPEIEALGFRVIHVPFRRRNTNPFAELMIAFRLCALFRKERPEIVHNISLKPILDGSLAALVIPKTKVINTFTGLGAIFIDDQKTGWLRRILVLVFRILMANPNVSAIVQNEDDLEFLTNLGIAHPRRTQTIRGSGVDTGVYTIQPDPEGIVTVTMVSRLLWDKGVGELLAAARILKKRNCDVRIVIVGTIDAENPNTVDHNTVSQWKNEGIVEFQGHRADIVNVWAESHIAVLPSYREGLPKSLLEAASCGKPMIATDVPGCRELVRNGENGLLVPAKNPDALADAIEMLVHDQQLRARLGIGARRSIEDRYSDTIIARETGHLYQQLLKSI